ncbi:hypothetical protein IMZ48_09335 [Candidatus Bathyarchaeota archaeon]|nr:hypothetical protein [Candidatus Bathyarchaeota archaeon]
MVGLLNDARLRAGQPTMGFLNPWLYGAAAGALTDVTGGAARGCGGIDLQTGMQVPGAGIVGKFGAFWNATAGESWFSGVVMARVELIWSRVGSCYWARVA